MSSFRRAFGLAAILLLASVLVPAPRASAAPQGVLVPPYSDVGVDEDGDGLYDILQVNVTFDATVAGRFYVTAFANGAPSAADWTTFGVGRHTVALPIPGWALFNLHINGGYTIFIQLQDGDSLAVLDEDQYRTGWYNYTDFDPPGALFESAGPDSVVDTNADGLYDALRVAYTLNVTDAGSYRIVGWLAANGTTVVDFDAVDLALGAGHSSGVLSVNGTRVRVLGVDGPYHVQISLMEAVDGHGSMVDSEFLWTAAYAGADFAPVWARLAPPFSDQGRDLDGDGLFEEIVVHVRVHLDWGSQVELTGGIGPGMTVQALNPGPRDLLAGDSVVDLLFPVFEFRAGGWNGALPVSITLRVPELPSYSEIVTNWTSEYSLDQFSPPSAVPQSPRWWTSDLDMDGAADQLHVSVNVVASKSGDVFVEAMLAAVPAGAPMLPAGRFLHLEAGSQANVTLTYSGVSVNRSGSDGPWWAAVYVTRLDSIPGDSNGIVAYTPAYARSQFVSRPHVAVDGQVISLRQGTGMGYSTVVAVDSIRDFWTWTTANFGGGYALDLYPGTFTLTVPSSDFDQTIALPVDVGGPTTVNLELPEPATGGVSWNATLDGWNATEVSTLRNDTLGSASRRISADIYGNLDGIASQAELLWNVRYPIEVPSTGPARKVTAGGLGLSIDGRSLAAGPETYTLLQGAGPYETPGTIVARSDTTFRDPAPPSLGSSHTIHLQLPYDRWYQESNLTLSVPDGFEGTVTAPADVIVEQPLPNTWSVNPYFSMSDYGSCANVTLNLYDAQKPVAGFRADPVERAVPVTFNGSESSDNVGVVNYSWDVAVNGTRRFGYGPTFRTIFPEIGIYVVSLSVQDAAGYADQLALSVVVRDTSPPPTPTGLNAVLAPGTGGTVVQLNWTSVVSDDLSGYRVYRSADAGTTFALLGQTAADIPAFTDASAGLGISYLYRVTAFDRYGNEAPPSTTVQARIPSSTGAPSAFDAGLWIMIGAVAVAAAAVAAVLIVRHRKARKPSPGDEPVR